ARTPPPARLRAAARSRPHAPRAPGTRDERPRTRGLSYGAPDGGLAPWARARARRDARHARRWASRTVTIQSFAFTPLTITARATIDAPTDTGADSASDDPADGAADGAAHPESRRRLGILAAESDRQRESGARGHRHDHCDADEPGGGEPRRRRDARHRAGAAD